MFRNFCVAVQSYKWLLLWWSWHQWGSWRPCWIPPPRPTRCSGPSSGGWGWGGSQRDSQTSSLAGEQPTRYILFKSSVYISRYQKVSVVSDNESLCVVAVSGVLGHLDWEQGSGRGCHEAGSDGRHPPPQLCRGRVRSVQSIPGLNKYLLTNTGSRDLKWPITSLCSGGGGATGSGTVRPSLSRLERAGIQYRGLTLTMNKLLNSNQNLFHTLKIMVSR